MKYFALLLLSFSLWAQTPSPCYFVNFGNEYDLVEGLTGNSNQNLYTLYSKDLSAYLQPGCASVSAKYIDLYSGENIASFSDESGGTGFNNLSISDSCSPQNTFSIANNQGAYLVSDHQGTCIAKIAGFENQVNQITLRDCNSKILGTAVKTLSNTPFQAPSQSFPSRATWKVKITGQNVPAQIIPYILAMKDNAGFSCPLPTPAPPTSAPASTGIPVGAAIAIAASVSVPTALMVWVVMNRYRKKDQAPYNQLQSISATTVQ